jgi:2-dehydropantoate 2-reductase
MKDIEQVLIVGAGAVGAAIASIIHRAQPESLAVLAEGERLQRYSKDGFIVNGERLHFRIVAPSDANSGSGGESFDLIILAVKNHHLDSALNHMGGFVGPRTTILSLLNGISSEDRIGSLYGPGPGAPENARLPPYAMILGIDAVRVDNATNFASAGKIFFGDKTNTKGSFSLRVQRIARFLEKVGIPFEVPEDMLRALWYKFMINVGINQASAVLRLPYRAFQILPEARSAMEAPMREVIALSQAMDIGLDETDLLNWEKTLAKLHPDNLTSMCQDVLAGRKTEVELFAGAVVELGRMHGVPTPANELYFNQLRTIECSYGDCKA